MLLPQNARFTQFWSLSGWTRRGTRADGHGRLLVVYSARGFLARIVCFESATSCLPKLIIAMKAAVDFPTKLTLAGHHV